MMIVIFGLIMAAGVAFAIWRFIQTPDEPMVRRVVDVVMALATAGAVFMAIGRTVQVGISDWNDAKLAPVVGMVKGYSLYQDPNSGVMTGWIYGPIGALILLPSALGKDPTSVGLIGSFICAFCYFAPAFWLFIRAGRGRVWWLVLLAVLMIVWQTIYLEDLCRCAFIASPDGPALGLGAVACAAIYNRRGLLNLGLSALAVVLCVWSKQNFITLPIGLAIWIAMTDGLEKAGIYVAMLAGIGLMISGAILFSFGPSNVIFHMFTLPSKHPFEHRPEGLLKVWYLGIDNLILWCQPSLIALGLAFLLDAWVRKPAANVVGWFGSRKWSVLLIAAISLIPGALLGFMKVGGFVNNLAVTNYFLMLAGLCAALDASAEVTEWDVPTAGSATYSAQKWVLAIVSTTMSVLIFTPAYVSVFGPKNSAADIWESFSHPYSNSRQTIYNYVVKHPNETYCPWNPLITLLADGKLYHFEWGLLDRGHASINPSMNQFVSHLPANTVRFVYIGIPQSMFAQQSTGIPMKRIDMPELPGCTVYVKAD